jgi:predicted chitinase
LLDSTLVTEPTFARVLDFVQMLQLLTDSDIVSVIAKRFGNLSPATDPLLKYLEFVDVVNTNSANLENPARFIYAAQFVKTGVLPDDADFVQADVAGVRAAALATAVNRALPVAHTINAAATAAQALTAILSACGTHGVDDLDPASYALATAHHESAMGRFSTEIANGISSATVFTRDAYFFNAIPGKKASYNTLAGNVKAGKTLKDAGDISAAADVALWNGTVYPDAQPVVVKLAARKCDFLVFIGRGYVQITGRTNYAKFSNEAALGNVDLLASPEKAAEPATAAGIMVLGMRDGRFRPNHKLADYDLAATWDATNARNIVNADVATYGAAIRELAKKYKVALIQVPKLDESKPLV